MADSVDDLRARLRAGIADDRERAKACADLLREGGFDEVEFLTGIVGGLSGEAMTRACIDLGLWRLPGTSDVMAAVLPRLTDSQDRIAIIEGLALVADGTAEKALLDLVYRGNREEAVYVIRRLAGYEPVPGRNQRLRDAATLRGDPDLVKLVDHDVEYFHALQAER